MGIGKQPKGVTGPAIYYEDGSVVEMKGVGVALMATAVFGVVLVHAAWVLPAPVLGFFNRWPLLIATPLIDVALMATVLVKSGALNLVAGGWRRRVLRRYRDFSMLWATFSLWSMAASAVISSAVDLWVRIVVGVVLAIGMGLPLIGLVLGILGPGVGDGE